MRRFVITAAVALAAAGLVSPGQAGAAPACTIVGTNGPDRLVGTAGDDVICGLGGDDDISGLAGNDIIRGGPGDDIIRGGPGDDTLVGGKGNDFLVGGEGNDRLVGGGGDDFIRAEAGNDWLYGNAGDDYLAANTGDDELYGGAGNDRLEGGPGDDYLDGGPGDDLLNGGPGDNTVIGRSSPPAPASPGRWTDPVGDSSGWHRGRRGHVPGAPDITAVAIGDDGGTLTIRVEIPNVEYLRPDVSLSLGLDTDRDLSADYSVRINGAQRNAALYQYPTSGSVLLKLDAPVVFQWRFGPTITLELGDIGSPAGFNFRANVRGKGSTSDTRTGGDSAPDGGPGYYQAGSASPPPPPAAAVFTARDIYDRPSRAYPAGQVVVHWVSAGPDAPPPADRNTNSVPDYVEQVAQAAELSLERFAALGFRPPSLDSRGSDNNIDIYLADVAGRWAGKAFPFHRSDGGYTIVESSIDNPDSLAALVAHELFHLVQFAYAPRAMPCWVGEGTAEAAETIAYPNGDFRAPHRHTEDWLKQPWKPLTAAAYGNTYEESSFCYAGRAWFQYLHERDPGLIPAYFERLSWSDSDDLDDLAAVISSRGLGTIGKLYSLFAASLYTAGHTIHTWDTIYPARPSRTAETTVAPLAAHYIPIKPLHGCTIEIGVRVWAGVSARLIVNSRLATPVQTNSWSSNYLENVCTNHGRADTLLVITGEFSGRFKDGRPLESGKYWISHKSE